MSADDDVRRYRRVLELNGTDLRKIAAGLLGVDPDRYLLLVHPWLGNDEAPHKYSYDVRERMLTGQAFHKVTGVLDPHAFDDPIGNGDGGVRMAETHRALWALPFLAFEEVHGLAAVFNAKAQEIVVWDKQDSRIVEWFGRASLPWSYDRVEDGWRSPRDSALSAER